MGLNNQSSGKITVFHYKTEVLEHLDHQDNDILQAMMVNACQLGWEPKELVKHYF